MIKSVPTNKALTTLIQGLSTDAKPTTNVLAFTLFIEEDTGTIYQFTGESWELYNPGGSFSAIAASMGTTNDFVDVVFSDVPQDFNPVTGVRILVDGVDDLKPATTAVLSGQTLTYALNSVASTSSNVVWEYTSPPGIISDGTDLAPSINLTAQVGIPATANNVITPQGDTIATPQLDDVIWQ